VAHGRLGAPLFRPYNGPGGVAAFFQELNANVGIEAFEPQEFVTEANRVLVTGWSRGLVKTTSRMFNNRWVMAFSVRDGKITQFEEYADTPSLGRRPRTRRSAQEIIDEETVASVSNEMLHRVVTDIAFPSSGAYAVDQYCPARS
jgi:hypothetical protein